MNTVPFYPQKWDLSQWKALGFSSEEDARYWERSCCGILCLQMAAEYYTKKTYTTHSVIEQGRALGAYTDEYGWSHAGLVQLAGELGMEAERGAYAPDDIARTLDAGGLVIISIKWGFRSQKSFKERLRFWKKYGGHLALVIGVERTNNKITHFIVHHTSIREGYNWEAQSVPLAQFKKGYTGRGITIFPK